MSPLMQVKGVGLKLLTKVATHMKSDPMFGSGLVNGLQHKKSREVVRKLVELGLPLDMASKVKEEEEVTTGACGHEKMAYVVWLSFYKPHY